MDIHYTTPGHPCGQSMHHSHLWHTSLAGNPSWPPAPKLIPKIEKPQEKPGLGSGDKFMISQGLVRDRDILSHVLLPFLCCTGLRGRCTGLYEAVALVVEPNEIFKE